MKKVKLYLIVFCLLGGFAGLAQIHSAKITFERKTNLYKKFKDQGTQRWIKEEDRIKIEYFELLVNDSMALFKPQESELRETYAWATAKNTVLQDSKMQSRYMIKTIWGAAKPSGRPTTAFAFTTGSVTTLYLLLVPKVLTVYPVQFWAWPLRMAVWCILQKRCRW
jgi:hypothetical protein